MSELFDDVVGQERAVATLRACAGRPVHAYLFVGPPGTGRAAAAVSFAAALLCPGAAEHGTDSCQTCRRVRNGLHPDVIQVEREGASIGIGAAREVIRVANLSPVEGGRKVVILHDFHLVRETGPALLKTIEEPPPATVFVVLAEYLPAELVTIASRCVRVDFAPLPAAEVAAALVRNGIEPERAAGLAAVAGGRLDRARLLATDPGFEARRRAWREVPEHLDGTGASVAALADRLVGLVEASVEPLRQRQEREIAEWGERNPGRGGRSKPPASLEERHRREQRRQRTDELRDGLAILAGAYRAGLAGGDPRRRGRAVKAVGLIDAAAATLQYNPGELLALQALLSRLAAAG